MKTILTISVFLISLLPIATSSLSAKTVNLAGVCGETNDISSKVLIEAYADIGYKVSITILPTERAIRESNMGRYDGEVMRIKGHEKNYPNLVMVPVPINRIEITVFTRDLEFEVTGWKDLGPYSIAYERGVKLIEYNTKGQ
ncbi:hypothetical protein [uncultured Desulfosarcina sp.]|uniref:hypothetical protein n=1 Tax=uncultured Desulfosarcina sp. TaxID=218289 RepID=UPI0029C6A008|nr:hypothetical protein [uncultured Desulfosarcina sp.]